MLAPLCRSDHAVLSCNMLYPADVARTAGDVKRIWNYAKGGYDKKRNLAASTDWKSLLNGKSSDAQYINFVSRMNEIRSECIPQKTVCKSGTQDKLLFNSTAKRFVRTKKAWNSYMRAKRLNKRNQHLLYDKYLKQRQRSSRRVFFYAYCNSEQKIREHVSEVKWADRSSTQKPEEVACSLNAYFKKVFTSEDETDYCMQMISFFNITPALGVLSSIVLIVRGKQHQ